MSPPNNRKREPWPWEDTAPTPQGPQAAPAPSSAQPAAAPREKSLEGFGENLLTSGGNFLGGMFHAVTNLPETGRSLYNLGAGAFGKLPGMHSTPEQARAAEAVWDEMVRRYGSPQKVMDTFYQDPVGALSDLSMLASGTGVGLKGVSLGANAAKAGRVARFAERGAQIAETVGNVTDPARLAYQTATLPLRSEKLAISPQRLYQSALKPGPGSYSTAEVRNIVGTGLREGLPVSEAGTRKLWDLVQDLNQQIQGVIDAGQNRGVTVDPTKVAGRLEDTKKVFRAQANPRADIRQLNKAGREFMEEHGTTSVPYTKIQPGMEGGFVPAGRGTTQVPEPIPAGRAQEIKVGTYRQLKDKSFGELKSAQIEGQKALARGIKEELVEAIPELKALNARDSSLLELAEALEHAVRRQTNHQLFGIGTPLAAAGVGAATGSAQAAAVAGGVRAMLDNPIIKSKLAIAINRSQKLNPGRFGPTRIATANARVDAYLQALQAAASASDESAAAPR